MKRKLTLTMALTFGVSVLLGAVRADELANELKTCQSGIETFNNHEGGMLAALNDEGRSPLERCGIALGLLYHYEGVRLWLGQSCYELVTEIEPDLVARVAKAEIAARQAVRVCREKGL